MVTGSQDIFPLTLLEQIRSFPWLKTPEKFLALARGFRKESCKNQPKSTYQLNYNKQQKWEKAQK